LLTYSDVRTYLQDKLTAAGYATLPTFDPGPGANLDALDTVPNGMVIISSWPGPGFDAEQVFDRQAFQFRTIGPQSDFEGAEQLAQDCDRAMVGFSISQYVNGKWWLSVQRAGGAPSLLLQDEGDRFHFYANYIVEVEYG